MTKRSGFIMHAIIAALMLVGCDSTGSVPIPADAQVDTSVATETPSNAQTADTAFIWGANGHPITAYPDISFDQQIDLLLGAGLDNYRINLRPTTTIEDLDELVTAAENRGVTILPILAPPYSFEQNSPDQIYELSLQTGREFAQYFGKRIPAWELGNELENYAIIQPCEMRDDGTQYPCEWGPAGGVNPDEYYGPRWAKVSAAIKGMSEGVAQGVPNALRAAGTAGWGHVGAFDRLKEDGVEWDISVWHSYQPPSEFKWAMEHLVKFEKPIWITEINRPYGSQDGEKAQAEYLQTTLQWLHDNSEKYQIGAIHLYELLDEPYWTDYEGIMGLYRVEKNADNNKWEVTGPKEAVAVIQAFAD